MNIPVMKFVKIGVSEHQWKLSSGIATGTLRSFDFGGAKSCRQPANIFTTGIWLSN